MFEELRQWQGSAETLTQVLEQKLRELNLSNEVPSVRTIRLWRSKQIFSQKKKFPFGFRQILEGLATVTLLNKGWTLAAIAQTLPTYSDHNLESQIMAESQNQAVLWSSHLLGSSAINIDLATDAVVLLAQGILKLYNNLSQGNKHSLVYQDKGLLSHELYLAMSKLGRLCIEQGNEDKYASVHQVLNEARNPFQEWDLEAFKNTDFPYSTAILIAPDLYIPTSDCSEIAQSRGSFGEENIIERRLYHNLCELINKLGSRRRQYQAYTAIRQLFGKYSLIDEKDLLKYLNEHELDVIRKDIVNNFYDPVHESLYIQGKIYQCCYCGTLLHPHIDIKRYPNGRCPIHQCRGHLDPKVSKSYEPQEFFLIAKPPILTYWTAPAIDELKIYETAIKLGLDAELYPDLDQCDIALKHRTIGIDAKSYRSPSLLASKLNRDIGGLKDYRQRIIAVSDYLIEDNPDYLDSLKSKLNDQGYPATLEILSVSQVLELLNHIRGLNYEKET